MIDFGRYETVRTFTRTLCPDRNPKNISFYLSGHLSGHCVRISGHTKEDAKTARKQEDRLYGHPSCGLSRHFSRHFVVIEYGV